METTMDFIVELWKPIVLSAVIVHVASAIVWMVLPIHKNDYKGAGDKEKSILDVLRSAALSPGVYCVPWCLPGAEKKDPALAERMKTGPNASITILSGPPNMGTSMAMWVLNLLIVGVIVAYIASHAGLDGAKYLRVFQLVGATAFLAHAGNAMTMSIWLGMPWSQLPGRVIDGLIYSLLTAGTFAWLWPTGVVAAP
jgi:hypothetical protein